MWSILSKILPFLPALIEKLWPDSAKVEQLKAERELAEAEAFNRGRISPRYLARYVAVVLVALFALVVLADVLWPDLVPGSPVSALEALGKQGLNLLATVFGL